MSHPITRESEPWVATGALDWLRQHIGSETRVLEYGCGGSTIWFAERARSVISLEHDPGYAEKVGALMRARKGCQVILHTRPYHQVITEGEFDFVLVDGRDRVQCATVAAPLIVPGGVLMLDNSERTRYDPIRKLLQTWELLGEAPGTGAEPGWLTTWWRKPEHRRPIPVVE